MIVTPRLQVRLLFKLIIMLFSLVVYVCFKPVNFILVTNSVDFKGRHMLIFAVYKFSYTLVDVVNKTVRLDI